MQDSKNATTAAATAHYQEQCVYFVDTLLAMTEARNIIDTVTDAFFFCAASNEVPVNIDRGHCIVKNLRVLSDLEKLAPSV